MSMEKYVSNSAEETRKIGMNFAKNLKSGDVVALYGDLGAGKTEFVKGIAEELDCEGEVSSPTFTLVNEYLGELPVYHFDVYRISRLTENDSGWIDDYLFGDGVCVVEWAENIESILPEGYIRAEITKNPDKGDGYREIKIC